MANHTRRSLFALGGMLLGGASALAGAEETRGSSDVARDRLKLAEDALKLAHQAIGRGQFAPGERDPVYIWSRRRMEARIELGANKADRIAAAQQHLDEMKLVERHVDNLNKAGQADHLSKMDAEYRRLEAEAWLAEQMAKA